MMGFKALYLNLKDNLIVKNTFYGLISMPIIKNMYDWVYFRHIGKIVKNFKPKFISIEPSNVCNLSCIMCPYKKMTRKKVTMSMNLYRKIIDDISQEGIKSVLLNFYNEPFLDKNLYERIDYAKKKGIETRFFSNGTVITKKKADGILMHPPDEIVFSFDGFSKKTYEKIRIGANFEKTLKNIQYLISRRNEMGLKKPEINVGLALMELNHEELADFKNFWKGKADRIIVGTVDNREQQKLGMKSFRKNSYPYPCIRAFQDPIVMADGKVTFCCIDYDGKYVVGDMNTQKFMEIYNSKKYLRIRKLHLNNMGNKIPLCKKCSHLYGLSAFQWWLVK